MHFRAAIVKFDKKQMTVDWKLEIKNKDPSKQASFFESEMHAINSMVQPAGSSLIYACGFTIVNSGDDIENVDYYHRASMVKVDEQGHIKYLYQWGGEYDTCKGITFNDEKKEITLILEVTSEALRPKYKSYSNAEKLAGEILIITMTENGRILKGQNINLFTSVPSSESDPSFYLGDNSLQAFGDKIIFAGSQVSFRTKYHTELVTDKDKQFFTSFLFSHNIDKEDSCLYTAQLSQRYLDQNTVKVDGAGSLEDRTNA
jgi:hypothetical protein